MKHITQSELHVKHVTGPFSYYLNSNETSILITLVKTVRPRVMIEFGCNVGLTAKRVLDNVPTIERYIGIDVPADRVPPLACQRTEVPQHAGIFAADDPRFYLLMRQARELQLDELEPCDAAFIDGDHSEQGVTEDTIMAASLVRTGGIICWHDAGNAGVQVDPVLQRFSEQGWPIVQVDGSWIAFCRR